VGGTEDVALTVSQIPLHTHTLMASADPGDNWVPDPAVALSASTGGPIYSSGSPPLDSMAAQALPPVGGGLPHTNMQPSLTLNFCIAVQGSLPSAG
jgi:microcystin-dependent protein